MRWLLCLVASTALADDHDGYPRALVERPLVLPRGVIEVGGQAMQHETDLVFGESIDASIGEARLRYGVGGVDFELAGQLVLGQSVPDGDTVEFPKYRAGSFAARVAIPGCLVAGAQIGKLNDIFQTTRWQGRAVLTGRRHMRATSALEVTGFIGRDWVRVGSPFRDTIDETYAWTIGAELRVQAQLLPTVAIEGRTVLAIRREGMIDFVEENDALVQLYGGRVIAVVAPKLDIHVGFDLLLSGGDRNTTQWVAGFATRLP